MMKKKSLSVVASAVLASAVAFSGCTDKGGSSNVAYTGVSIDGYLSGSKVSVGGHPTTTDVNGTWTISMPWSEPVQFVTTTGGTDISTGQPFEGQVSAVINSDGNTVVTPITSLVAALVKKGMSNTAAIKKIAKAIGVSSDAITSDPIKVLAAKKSFIVTALAATSGPSREDAQKVIKASLVVQKVAEAFAHSVVTKSSSSQFNVVTNAVFEHIANKINTTTTTTTSIFNTIVENTSSIATATAKTLNTRTLFKSVSDVKQKLEASVSAIKSVTKTLVSISTSSITSTTTFVHISKAIEIQTSVIESKLNNIAKATTVSQIEKKGTDAETTATTLEKTKITTMANVITTNTVIPDVITSVKQDINSSSDLNMTKIIKSNTVIPAEINTSASALSGTGKVSDTGLKVDKIETGSPASTHAFYVESKKLSGSTYADIKTQLKSLLNIKLTATDSTSSSVDGDYLFTFLIKSKNNKHYLAVSTKAHFEKTAGDLNITAVPNSDLILQTDIQNISAGATKPIGSEKPVTSTTDANGSVVITMNVASIVDVFAKDNNIGKTIKKYLVNYTTTAGSYNTYLLINKLDNNDNPSFISATNSVKIDAISYKNLGITYGNSEKAIKVHTKIK